MPRASSPFGCDLSTADGVDTLYGRIASTGRPVEAVALNAGVGAGGAFATDATLEDELRLIDLEDADAGRPLWSKRSGHAGR